MRNSVLTLLMMIAVGVFASAQGRDTRTLNVQALDAVESQHPYVVLAKSGTRQQRDTTRECLVTPNRDLSQGQPDAHDTRVMKGLVF